MRILIVTPYMPHRDLGHGTSTIVSQFVDYFASRHDLSVLTFYSHSEELALGSKIAEQCADFRAIRLSVSWRERQFARLKSAVARRPLLITIFNAPAMRREIRKIMDTKGFDIVQIDSTQMGQYVDLVRNGKSRKALVEIDVSMKPLRRRYEQERSVLKRLRYWSEWRLMRSYEPALCENFDIVYTVTEDDRDLLHSINPTLKVSSFRVGADPALFEIPAKTTEENTIVFIGAFMHPPNVDAAIWFHDSIFPLIRDRVHDVKVYYVGGSPPPEIQELGKEPNVHVTGGALGPAHLGKAARSDVGSFLSMADVCIVPLRWGGGVKLKTVEMMAAGRAVVTTSVGCEGLNVRDGEHLLIADSPEDFAAKVVSLLRNRAARMELGRKCRALAQQEHQWQTNLRQIERDYETLISDSTPR